MISGATCARAASSMITVIALSAWEFIQEACRTAHMLTTAAGLSATARARRSAGRGYRVGAAERWGGRRQNMGRRSRFRGGTGRLAFAWNGPGMGLPGERKQMNHLQRTRRLIRLALTLGLMVAT